MDSFAPSLILVHGNQTSSRFNIYRSFPCTTIYHRATSKVAPATNVQADLRYPPVLWEWFVEEFSGPTAWLESRTKFSRTLAVMSFVGYVLGLGDRHSENILLDATTGAAVHVDFNCLFEKALSQEAGVLTVGSKL